MLWKFFSVPLVTLVSYIYPSIVVDPLPPGLCISTLDFRIAIFSDLHFGENEDSFGILQDENSTQLMEFVLEVEVPDLAVLNGDLITGENTFAFNSTEYLNRIVAPLEEKSVPWASTYGNHDSKYNLSREGILQQEGKHRLSLTRHGPEDETDGVTNYVVPLRTSGNGVPLALLWFFDSRGGSRGDPENRDNIPDFVSARTADWFRRTSELARQRWGVIPSFAFVHIPIRAFLDLQESTTANVSGAHYPGMNADIPVAREGRGVDDDPFMQALLDTPGLQSIYSGHDHGNSWCGRWLNSTLPGRSDSSNERPILCFSKHSGFGGYGTWNRGVRILQLSWNYMTQLTVNTWVRMQTGEVVTAVSLNETYGTDMYPKVDGGYHSY